MLHVKVSSVVAGTSKRTDTVRQRTNKVAAIASTALHKKTKRQKQNKNKLYVMAQA
jgi:hypothetical protein